MSLHDGLKIKKEGGGDFVMSGEKAKSGQGNCINK